jgi:hypothetical protein
MFAPLQAKTPTASSIAHTPPDALVSASVRNRTEPDAPVANLTTTLSEPNVHPGDELTVTLTLSNEGTKTGNATAINLTQWPAGWTVTSSNDGWKDRQLTWTSLANPGTGDAYDVTATVGVPENASEGEYALEASGFVATSVRADATATVTVSEGFSVDGYDTDGDGTVEGDLTGVLQTLADYNNGATTFQQLLQVIAASNGS